MSPVVSSIWVLVVLVARKGANAVALFILARLLGADDFGAYSFVISAITILSVLSLFGLERLSARELAKYLATDALAQARGFLLWGAALVGAASLAVAIAGYPALSFLGGRLDNAIQDGMAIGLLIVPIMAFLAFLRGVLRGLHRPVLSHTPESLIRPIALIVIVLSLIVLGADWNARTAIWSFAGASILALGFALASAWHNMPAGITNAETRIEGRVWTRSAAVFSVNSLFTVLNAEALVIILGLVTDTAETGAFKLAANLSGLISFVLIAINVPLGPTVARQLARGEISELQETVTRLARMGLLMAAPMALGCWFFGEWLLALFGAGFTSAYPALAVLALAQLLAVTMGSVASVLVNAGYEGLATRAITAGTIVNLAGAVLLIPLMGSLGAAIGFAAGTLTGNAMMMYYAARETGLDTSVLGLRRVVVPGPD